MCWGGKNLQMGHGASVIVDLPGAALGIGQRRCADSDEWQELVDPEMVRRPRHSVSVGDQFPYVL